MNNAKMKEKEAKKLAKKERKTNFFKELKDFIFRGNVMSMAVGVIVGGAFQKIVTSLVNDVIMPIIGAGFRFNLKDAKWVLVEAVMDGDKVVKSAVTLAYGNFIQTILDFVIIALSLFIALKVATRVGQIMTKAKEDILEKLKEKEALSDTQNGGTVAETAEIIAEESKVETQQVIAKEDNTAKPLAAICGVMETAEISDNATTTALLTEIRNLLRDKN